MRFVMDVMYLLRLILEINCNYFPNSFNQAIFVMETVYTGLFTSPSGISELDCATTKTDTAERSISIGRESLQVFFFLY